MVYGNGLQITNLTWNQPAQTLTFTVSWQNAWRLTTPPNNWDAVWIFVKFRDCNAPANDPWTHGLISTNLSDHTFPAALEPVLSDGSNVGIDPAPNNTGIMLRPVNIGNFATIGPATVTIKVTNLPTTGTYNVKVLGIEMVYIPQESYILGTLSGNFSWGDQAAYAFDQNGNSSDPHAPYTITSENAINIRWAGNSTGVNLPAAYPKGYAAFHIMKYEISQGEYAEFLNTIPSSAALQHYPGNFNNYRNRLSASGTPPDVYWSNRPDRAQNYLSWADVTAFLDWAALRPISEMEYEKACRGAGPLVLGEYAWGTTSIAAGTMINKTPEDGTEEFSNAGANCTYNNVTYTGGDGGQGPVRVGIHAKTVPSTREASGATYYGVLDMSGNVWEMVVLVANESATFTRTWGDGYLDPTTNNHDVATWPTANTSPSPFGLRGGSWWNNWQDQRVSARWCSHATHTCMGTRNPSFRSYEVGGRGVR
jgi:formylglycine-generating enzyme required for sulfatase activity